MSGFELNKIYRIEDVVQWVRSREDRQHIYALYAEQDTDELVQGMRVLVGETPSFDEDDNEVMPLVVQTLGFEFCYACDQFQDVIDLALSQDAGVTTHTLIECLNHYAIHDDFLDVYP
ncbi:hypothetical protein P5705_10715 [Pseudomonas entomophila]|uniref:DUF7716 domain-containing protein n=1 Tax=Pseudomonas entomophila TaxID=312306 RepID=UPI002406E72B|nr:hypothetical protein [Pseudomonas entomophila]MDF9618115.1 hypothetical protein [Pseudomonas entomophila]